MERRCKKKENFIGREVSPIEFRKDTRSTSLCGTGKSETSISMEGFETPW